MGLGQGIFDLFPVIEMGENIKSYFKDSIIHSINIFNSQKKIEILLKSSSLIPREIIHIVMNEIKKEYGIEEININLGYTNMDGSVEEILSNYWPSLVSHLNVKIPISKGAFSNCKWELKDDNKLIINLSSAGSFLLKSKGCHSEIQKVISEELNIKTRVEFLDPQMPKDEEEYYVNLRNEMESKVVAQVLNSNGNSGGNGHPEKPKEKAAVESKKDNKPVNTPNFFKSKKLEESNDPNIILGRPFNGEAVQITGLNDQSGRVIIEGDITNIESRQTNSGKYIFAFDVTDYKNSITCKFFINENDFEIINENLKEGMKVRTQGEVVFDKYSREVVMMVSNIKKLEKTVKKDSSEEKRVELHAHTMMSSMDGVISASDLVKRAAAWGHKAIAITDHGVVQAYPEAHEASKKHGIKILYGIECYLLDDKVSILSNTKGSVGNTFVVFDIETTGFYSEKDKITEIGAVKVKDGKIIDSFNVFVNPQMHIPEKITELTGITDEMVKDAEPIEHVLPKFLEFVGDSVFVAHNANFDTGFIRYNAGKLGIELDNAILDTLELSRVLLPHLKRHKLNLICDELGVSLENHHRAVDDARATAEVFLKFLDMLKDQGLEDISEINKKFSASKEFSKMSSYHAVIFVKNYTGLYNLYRLVSESHLKYYYKKPGIPKTMFSENREGLIIGTACNSGELYKAVLDNRDEEDILNIARFYDYLEIQPVENYRFLVEKERIDSIESLKNINKKIVDIGEKLNIPVVATGDVHFLDPHEEIFRRILTASQGFDDENPSLYFKTTEEMLAEFGYLGKEKAYEVVIKNTNMVADMLEDIKPIPDETFPPKIEGAEEEITRLTMEKAKEVYGDPLPEIVEKRIEKELNSIIKNGFSVMYIIAQKLVSKSLSDGYLVGSRGSVGSSLVAHFSGITEVNSLPPHYVCPSCKYSEFFADGSIGSGYDLPDKDCPKCGSKLHGDGQDIPFETFLGFDGDKEPDIDLNFSGEYQPVAHKYTEELFGEGQVFRAGTIGTIAEKTAYGYVKNYLEDRGIVTNNAEINRLVKGCTGVKRTTGQHPGGVMIVPRGHSIYEFCPVQHPADDTGSNIITTHFDYHSISGRLLKLDILGHDDPTVIRMLEDLTGVDAKKIPLGDTKVLSLFTSTEAMGIKPEDINSDVGSFALPEFGTKFVRQMLVDTQPKTFAELMRISGLSHGTDVWLNNAQDLVRNGTAVLSEVICTRDDIMVYLIYRGLPPKPAFKIMEQVRKGKGLKPEDEELMRVHSVPEWYIDSCKKIKYMFPKAHAAAYVLMCVRIAWFKMYYPEAFYVTYFTVRADDFDAALMTHGPERVRSKLKEIEQKGNQATTKEKNVLTILEVALEMYARGIKFLPIDLYKSDAQKFIITKEGILPPLNGLQGLGLAAAQNIVKSREEGQFMSKDDLRIRAKISKAVIEILDENGVLKDIPESNQISLFG